MLQIKTYLDKSSIDGLGVFAAEDIKEGAIVWKFNPMFDRVLEGHLDRFKFSGHIVEWVFVNKYAYKDKQLGVWILSADNDKYTNHSDNPNTEPLENGWVIAIKDIKRGEEITINYYEIDDDAEKKLQALKNDVK